MDAKKIKLVLVLLILAVAIHSAFAALKTFTVQETDLVKINAEAVDPDGDELSYSYSLPLDENGEWQTEYGDAGEYNLKITASDGINKTEEKVILIVKKKNQPPFTTEKKVSVKETQQLDLKNFVSDPDNDILSYTFNAPFDKNGLWATGYEDAGDYVAHFTISDGEFNVKAQIGVKVLNTNQPPLITDTFSDDKAVKIKENQDMHFYVEAVDGDDDELTYLWKLDDKLVSETSDCNHYFDFESSGEHLLTLSVSDGNKEITKEWLLEVENVNRKPELDLPSLEVDEGQKAVLELPERDLDGDKLTYSFDDKFDYFGVWETGYDDAGAYEIVVYVSDGEFTVESVVKVKVIDVDRAPELILPESVEVYEGEELSFSIETSDPDGDEIIVFLQNAPEGSLLDGKEFSWNVSYEFIKRKGGMVSNLLNTLRLEHLFLKHRTVTMDVTSCGKDLCTSKPLFLRVYNVNRAPVIEELLNAAIKENEIAFLTPKAADPDGDIVRVTFSDPFNKKGSWDTGYGDKGRHIIYVAATDGKITTTIPVEIDVKKDNREPRLKISSDKIIVNEGQEFSITVDADDPDGDELSISLENLPDGASFKDGVFTWKPGYETVQNGSSSWTDNLVSELSYLNKKFSQTEETVWLTFAASDGEFEVLHPVKVIVKNVNKEPEFLDYLPQETLTARAGEPVIFHVAAKDVDNDKLDYRWSFGLGAKKVSGTDTIERTFLTSGEKKVRVVVSDGSREIAKEWTVNVLEQMFTEKSVSFTAEDFEIYVIEG